MTNKIIRVWCETETCQDFHNSVSYYDVALPNPNICFHCQEEITGFAIINQSN
jgi:hypothetical protein